MKELTILNIQLCFTALVGSLCMGCSSASFSLGEPHYAPSLEYLMEMPITSGLWSNTNPNEKVSVLTKDVSEGELNELNIEYTYYDDLGNETGYLIKKSDLRKFQNYTVRLLGTPITLGADVVVFAVLFWLESP